MNLTTDSIIKATKRMRVAGFVFMGLGQAGILGALLLVLQQRGGGSALLPPLPVALGGLFCYFCGRVFGIVVRQREKRSKGV